MLIFYLIFYFYFNQSQPSSKKESIKPEEDTPEMIEAATKIQAVYRGFKTRSELKQVAKFTIKNFNKLFFKILLFQKTNEITS